MSPALPDMDDVKDTLDDDQLRLFEEMRAATDVMDNEDRNDDVGVQGTDSAALPYDAKD